MTSIQSMVKCAGEFASDLFSRGYIISDNSASCPPGWGETQLDQFLINYHPHLQITCAKGERTAIVVLGIIFDTRDTELTQQGYVENLLEGLTISESAMHELLSHSNGRYTILYRASDGLHYVVHDATGMRTVLYHFGTHATVSSHLNLLSVNAGQAEERDERSFRFGFPGRMTPIKNVVFLTPNTKLCMETQRVERYWPGLAMTQISLDEAARHIAMRLENSFKWVSSRYNAFVSITAGLDSRVTLSITKNKARYVTYFRRDEADTDLLDRDMSVTFAAEFNLKHTMLTRNERGPIAQSYLDTVKLNTFRPHLPGMTYAYRNLVRDSSRAVHIRSNLSEIGRMFYQGRGSDPKTAEDLVSLWTSEKTWQTSENIQAFHDFADSSNFFQAPVELTSLFYWEHRMGAWHSQVALESDIACESLSLYNCRSILATMWCLPLEVQKRSLLMKRIIHNCWPELTRFPVNGKPFAPGRAADRDAVFS